MKFTYFRCLLKYACAGMVSVLLFVSGLQGAQGQGAQPQGMASSYEAPRCHVTVRCKQWLNLLPKLFSMQFYLGPAEQEFVRAGSSWKIGNWRVRELKLEPDVFCFITERNSGTLQVAKMVPVNYMEDLRGRLGWGVFGGVARGVLAAACLCPGVIAAAGVGSLGLAGVYGIFTKHRATVSAKRFRELQQREVREAGTDAQQAYFQRTQTCAGVINEDCQRLFKGNALSLAGAAGKSLFKFICFPVGLYQWIRDVRIRAGIEELSNMDVLGAITAANNYDINGKRLIYNEKLSNYFSMQNRLIETSRKCALCGENKHGTQVATKLVQDEYVRNLQALEEAHGPQGITNTKFVQRKPLPRGN